MDWLDLLAVRGTLANVLQHHSSKASILQCSAFFIVQLSHPYMTTGITIALTRRTFVGKVVSLLFNMLSRFVITFLSRKFNAWKFNFIAAITTCSDYGAPKNEVSHCFQFYNLLALLIRSKHTLSTHQLCSGRDVEIGTDKSCKLTFSCLCHTAQSGWGWKYGWIFTHRLIIPVSALVSSPTTFQKSLI